MTALDGALADASRLGAAFTAPTGYALAYGSHADHQASPDSDLDLLFVGPTLSADRLRRLVQSVETLHHEHALRLDTEVAYEVKLHATEPEVDAALRLQGFTVNPNGRLYIPPVVVEPWFLNSTPFKLRLILNALTTPHVFLGGDVARYRRNCVTADRTVTLVALALLDPATLFTVADAIRVLVYGSGGVTGEDFLGYTHGPQLHGALHRGLAHLVSERAVDVVDGATFRQWPEQRCRLLAALLPPTSGPVAEPGTLATGEGGSKVEQH